MMKIKLYCGSQGSISKAIIWLQMSWNILLWSTFMVFLCNFDCLIAGLLLIYQHLQGPTRNQLLCFSWIFHQWLDWMMTECACGDISAKLYCISSYTFGRSFEVKCPMSCTQSTFSFIWNSVSAVTADCKLL